MADTKAKKNQKQMGKGMAIASMVCGIVSLVLFWSWCLAIICAIVALVLGIIALVKKADGKGMAIAGVVTGGCGLLISGIIAIFALIALAAVTGTVTNAIESYDWSTLTDDTESSIVEWESNFDACVERNNLSDKDYDQMTEAEQDAYWNCFFE